MWPIGFDRHHRVSLAAFALRIVDQEEGVTLDDLTFGEIGKRRIQEWYGGNLAVMSAGRIAGHGPAENPGPCPSNEAAVCEGRFGYAATSCRRLRGSRGRFGGRVPPSPRIP